MSPLRRRVSYAAVFPLVRTRAFAEAFDYEIPRELAAGVLPGALVAVPLGAQTVIGVVLETREQTAHEGRVLPLRDVLRVPPIPGDLLGVARRVQQHYLTSFSAALALVCPPTGALKIERRYALTHAGATAAEAGESRLRDLDAVRLQAGPLAADAERYRRKGWLRVAYRVHVVGVTAPVRTLRRGPETPARLGPRQRAALELVDDAGQLEERELRAVSGLSAAGLRRLLEGGALVAGEPAPSFDVPAPDLPGEEDDAIAPPAAAQAARLQACATLSDIPDLLDEQRRALHSILCDTRPGDEVLLHGVTGSGKTEVYLQAAQATLEAGRSVLLLVPEIGLTGQTVARVKRRFAGAHVAVLHSGLSAGERLLAYAAVARGEVRIVVGARSAVFAPLVDLGLIVVDEEHDTSYKQESEPAYDARTVAGWRAAASGAVVVLGSATPSVESFDRVALHADLHTRVDGSQPPALEIVDMRGHHGVFSAPLAEALSDVVDAGEKAILFLNRRGFAAYLVCDHCGHAWECPDCDVTLALFGSRTLRCRTCGHTEPAPSVCPECGRSDLVRHGYGTERLEREVRLLLPGVDLLRLDSDVAGSYARLQSVLGRFAEPGPKGARGHADDRQRAPLSGRDPGRRGRRRPHAALSGLPRRGTHLLAADPGRRPQRPRRAARPGHRADARPRGAAHRPCRRRRRGEVLRRGARAPAGAGLSARRLPRRSRPLGQLEGQGRGRRALHGRAAGRPPRRGRPGPRPRTALARAGPSRLPHRDKD